MSIDLTRVFKTPDELADFCLMDNRRQDALLAKYAEQGKIAAELSCACDPLE